MFKAVAFVLLGLAAATLAYRIENHNGVSTLIFENEINQTLQDILAGLPEPIEIEHLDITLPDNSPLTGTLTLDNLVLSGIKGLQLTQLSLGIFLDLSLTAVIPQLTVQTGYNADAFYGSDALYGEGTANIVLNNIVITATANVQLEVPPQVNNLKFTLHLDDGVFDITGIFNDPDLSAQISQDLTDNAASIVNDNADAISDAFSPVVQDLVNALLAALLGGGEKNFEQFKLPVV